MLNFSLKTDLFKGPLVVSVLCILIDEGVQPLWDDCAVKKDCT